MEVKPITVSEIKKREISQANAALVSTLAPKGDVRRYDELDVGLDKYSEDLFGSKDMLVQKVRIGLRSNKDKSFNILVLGAGTGKMAEELAERLGRPENLNITEIGMGDPREPEQKRYDGEHNIKFINKSINETRLENFHYNLVLSRMFLLHMTDPLRVVKKIEKTMVKGGEFYADFQFTGGLVPFFRSDNTATSEDKAHRVLEMVRAKGSIFFVDDTGMYFKKNESTLKFDNLHYRRDKKDRIYYDLEI